MKKSPKKSRKAPRLLVKGLMRVSKKLIARIVFWPLLTATLIFAIGGATPHYSPNPTIEGRRLSVWVSALQTPGFETAEHYKAITVLCRNAHVVLPALNRWSCRTDSFPQQVYFMAMTIAEGKNRGLDYWGSYCTRADAAKALGCVASVNKEAIAPLAKLLHDPVDYVREEAAAAFMTMGSNARFAAVDLVAATHDRDGIVQRNATESLASLELIPDKPTEN
jgi:hypothetical protein